jgi:hypothetical protein
MLAKKQANTGLLLDAFTEVNHSRKRRLVVRGLKQN